jgi:hypothetical protein
MTPPTGTRVIWHRLPRRGRPWSTPRVPVLGFVRKRDGQQALVELDDGTVAWARVQHLEVVGNE